MIVLVRWYLCGAIKSFVNLPGICCDDWSYWHAAKYFRDRCESHRAHTNTTVRRRCGLASILTHIRVQSTTYPCNCQWQFEVRPPVSLRSRNRAVLVHPVLFALQLYDRHNNNKMKIENSAKNKCKPRRKMLHSSQRWRSHTFVGTSQWGAELCSIENASQNFRLMPTTIQMGVQATFARQIGYAAYVTIVQPLFRLIAIRIAGEYVSFGAIGQIHRDAKHMPFHLLFHLFVVMIIIIVKSRGQQSRWIFLDADTNYCLELLMSAAFFLPRNQNQYITLNHWLSHWHWKANVSFQFKGDRIGIESNRPVLNFFLKRNSNVISL